MHRLVSHIHMHGVVIGIRIDRHCLDAHPARGFHDAAGDFAAIGDQDFLEHAGGLPKQDRLVFWFGGFSSRPALGKRACGPDQFASRSRKLMM